MTSVLEVMTNGRDNGGRSGSALLVAPMRGRAEKEGDTVNTRDALNSTVMDPDPEDAVRDLAAALETAGITLPSLSVDTGHANERVLLVELGRVRPDVAITLAAVIRRGATR